MFDDEDIKKVQPDSVQRNLENMSIDELEDYIQELKTEIKRAEDDIHKKKAVFSAADDVFK